MIPPYKIYEDGSIEADGYMFRDGYEFGTYCDWKEACDDYWRNQEQMEQEEREYRLEELNRLLVEL